MSDEQVELVAADLSPPVYCPGSKLRQLQTRVWLEGDSPTINDEADDVLNTKSCVQVLKWVNSRRKRGE